MMLKGNAIVGQSGGPTSAINATLSGVIRGALDSPAIGTIYGAFNGIEGILGGRFCDLSTIFSDRESLRLLENTPAAALGSCRVKLPDPYSGDGRETYEKLIAFFRRLDIRYFFYIGGNDSMDTVAKLSKYCSVCGYEMRVIGVPKTIDNDLAGTDHTPGYGSAAKFIAVTMQEILRDCAVYTTKAVTIVEIMGRDAGWLTASASLTRDICGVSPDFIYLPERPFELDSFFSDLDSAFKRHSNVVVAISEGIRASDGVYVGAAGYKGKDVFGHVNLSGAGKFLEMTVKEKLGCKVRSVELNIPQRCAAHLTSNTDIEESVAIGKAGVKAAENGETGRMMCFVRVSNDPYKTDIVSNDIDKIANAVKTVPDSFISESGSFVTEDCVSYSNRSSSARSSRSGRTVCRCISPSRGTEEENNMTIHELILKNRSYRSFDHSAKLPHELLVSFVDNARLTMSSVNFQPLKYFIADDEETCSKIRPHTYWARLLPGYDGPDAEHSPSAYIVLLHDKSVAPNVERFEKDAGICAQTIMLSAVEAGFGGCMIGNFDAPAISEITGIGDDLVPRLVLALGLPDEKIILEDLENGAPSAYYRDVDGRHHVPKRRLDDVLVNR